MKSLNSTIFLLGFIFTGLQTLTSCKKKENTIGTYSPTLGPPLRSNAGNNPEENPKSPPLSTLEVDPKNFIDSDNDGINDALEIKNGSNPLIANFPKFTLSYVEEVVVSANYQGNTGGAPTLLVKKANTIYEEKLVGNEMTNALREKVVQNQINFIKNINAKTQDFITIEDINANLLSNWDEKNFYDWKNSLINTSYNTNNSGKISSNFKIQLSDVDKVTEISNINFESFYYLPTSSRKDVIGEHYLLTNTGSKETFILNEEASFSPISLYTLLINELDSNTLHSYMAPGYEIGLRFKNFDYKRLGTKLNFLDVFNKVSESNSKLIFSTGSKTEVFFVNSNLTIEEALIQLGKKVTATNDGHISSVDELESTLMIPFNLNDYSNSDLERGQWNIFGDGIELTSKMQAKGTYIISYFTVKDYIKFNRTSSYLDGKGEVVELKTGTVIHNIYEGDQLFIDISNVKLTGLEEQKIWHDIPKTTKTICHEDPHNRYNAHPGLNRICYEQETLPACYNYIYAYTHSAFNGPVNPVNGTLSIGSLATSFIAFTDELGENVNFKIYRDKQTLIIKFDNLKNRLKNQLTMKVFDPNNRKGNVRSGMTKGSCAQITDNVQTLQFDYQLYIYGVVLVTTAFKN